MKCLSNSICVIGDVNAGTSKRLAFIELHGQKVTAKNDLNLKVLYEQIELTIKFENVARAS